MDILKELSYFTTKMIYNAVPVRLLRCSMTLRVQVQSHKAKAVLAKHDQTPKPQHVKKHYIMSAKETGHLNLHEHETSEGEWEG